MSGFQVVVLWSDILIWLLVVAGIGLSIFISRNEPLLAAWRRVGANRIGMASATVLLVFIGIGLLDSLHYRAQLESKPGQTARYGIEVLSALDALLTPLRTQNEKTYSAPFATRLFAKETIDVAGKGSVRDYPRLKFGGKHLGDHEDQVENDVSHQVFRMSILTLLAWGILLALVTTLLARRASAVNTAILAKIWRGETGFAWNAVLITLGLIGLFLVPLLSLSSQYHVFGTDKVGQDVLYQILKSVRTGLIIGLAMAGPLHAEPPTTAVLGTPPQPGWSLLSTPQKIILAPLAGDWDQMDNLRRKKWLGIAERFPKMTPDEQGRIQERMREWAALTPAQRAKVRDSYKEFNQLDADKKKAVKDKWTAYSKLSEEEKALLRQGKPAPKAAGQTQNSAPNTELTVTNSSTPPNKIESATKSDGQ